jgi:fimbrial isopeptide formation D2 family protein
MVITPPANSTTNGRILVGTSPTATPTNFNRIDNITVGAGTTTVNQSARLVDPSGVVYDSISRSPIAGATVCLLGPADIALPNSQLSSATPNCQITGVDGAYAFFINDTAPTGAYALRVTQPAAYLPVTAVLGGVMTPSATPCPVQAAAAGIYAVQPQHTAPTPDMTGAATVYCMRFNGFGPAAQDIIHNHIPLDPRLVPKLTLSKTANQSQVTIGDTVEYTLTLRRTDATLGLLSGAAIKDTLPVGFTYLPGTTKVDGASISDTAAGLNGLGNKPNMLIKLSATLAAGQSIVVTYRVRVGVGAAQGLATNRAQAQRSATTSCSAMPNDCSNEARSTVQIKSGVFSNTACVFGAIYTDCNGNGMADNEEIGIPGVRLYLLDGTSVITDSEGKFSACDLPAKTNVLSVDKTTLPKGSVLGLTSNRNAGDASSLFLDIKRGELHRANFALTSCSPAVMQQIKQRRGQGEVRAVGTDIVSSISGMKVSVYLNALPKGEMVTNGVTVQ